MRAGCGSGHEPVDTRHTSATSIAAEPDWSRATDSSDCVSGVPYSWGVSGAPLAAVELLSHLRRARDHIDAHFAENVHLDRLARVAGVSRFHFARSFEACYGQTPIRYLTRRRIERAQDLLRSANLTITEICMVVGFSSLGSFSARFRDLVGESPSAYRARWAATGGPHIPGCYLFMWGLRPVEQPERSIVDNAVRTVDP
jgi:AraC-like DNA-binding protein